MVGSERRVSVDAEKNSVSATARNKSMLTPDVALVCKIFYRKDRDSVVTQSGINSIGRRRLFKLMIVVVQWSVMVQNLRFQRCQKQI